MAASRQKWRAKNREQDNAANVRWKQRRREQDPTWAAAEGGFRYAVGRGWKRPEDVTYTAIIQETLPFYAAARKLTTATGVRHEVDHKVPLRFGGQHRAHNLQVLTHKANAKKRSVDKTIYG